MKSTAAEDRFHPPAPTEGPELSKVVASVQRVKDTLLSQDEVPNAASITAALRTCRNAATLIQEYFAQPQISGRATQSGTVTSDLLSLDGNGAKATQKPQSKPADLGRAREAIDSISDAVYAIIAHQNILITPQLLGQYVFLQARLGRPETLPHVFRLYASKSQPRGAAGSISYVKQNPNKLAKAVSPEVVDKALEVAIEAKNMDAAIGIIENTYATRAFIKSKILTKALVPIAAFAAAPAAVFILARNLSQLQNTMDDANATAVAFAGVLTYVACTAAFGVFSVATQNDQMKRVTWAPGMALRDRWMREEERAALDTVACAFGFSEKHRWGEEQGVEFQTLREYILRKGMILDRVELMEGMS